MDFAPKRRRKTITAHFLETTRHCGQPMHSMHSALVALGGPQTNSSSLQSGLLSAKATPEPNTIAATCAAADPMSLAQ